MDQLETRVIFSSRKTLVRFPDKEELDLDGLKICTTINCTNSHSKVYTLRKNGGDLLDEILINELSREHKSVEDAECYFQTIGKKLQDLYHEKEFMVLVGRINGNTVRYKLKI